jgi:transcriptional regulator with XRE-family HTH domain
LATIGEKIRALRQRRSWTLKDLADKTNLSVPYLSDIERRREINPTLETLTSIAGALECPVGELLGDADGSQINSMSRSEPPLPVSLQRFVRGDSFAKRLEKLATTAGRDPKDMEREVINFLVHAPKRARSDLNTRDWEQLLNFYGAVILEE